MPTHPEAETMGRRPGDPHQAGEGHVASWRLRAILPYLWLAVFHARRGRTVAAEACYRKVLSQHPNQLAAVTGLAQLLMRQKRFAEAGLLWRQAIALRPGYVAAIFQLGRTAHRLGNLEEAAGHYLQVVALEPAHDKALSALEEIALRFVKTETTGSDRDMVVEIGLGVRTAESRRARAVAAAIAHAIADKASARMSRDPERALVDLRRAGVVCPGLAEVLRSLARCYEQLSQLDDAIAALDSFLEIRPGSMEARLQRDRLQVLLDSQEAAPPKGPTDRYAGTPRAPSAFGRTARRESSQRLAMLRQGRRTSAAKKAAAETAEVDRLMQEARTAYNAGRLEEAEARFGDVLALRQEHAPALAALARLVFRQRRLAEAIGLLSRWQRLQPASVEIKDMLARAFLQEGQIGAAARLYEQLVELEPDNAAFHRGLGRAKARLEDWSGACRAWAAVCELETDRHDARIELALALYADGRQGEAETHVQHVLRFDPDSRPGLRLLARMRHAAEPGAAVGLWQRLAELEPNRSEPLIQAARLLVRLDRHAEAEAAFRRALERDPDNREALSSLAKLVAPRDPGTALSLLSGWRKRSPDDLAPILATARLHAANNQWDPAVAAFLEAREKEPNNLEVLTGLGRAYSSARKIDDAIALWSDISERAPETLEPKLQLARILHPRRDPRAELLLQSVLKTEPDHREALRLLARLYGRSASTVERALETWDRLAMLDPRDVSPLVHRGRLLEGARRFDEAEEEFRRALTRNPSAPMALADFARFARVQKRYEAAIEVYQALLHVDPDRMDALLGLGQCLDRLNRLEAAQSYYEQALRRDPANVTALGYRGRLLRARGQVDAAILDFQEICRLDPGNAEAWHELIFQLAGAERETEALAAVARAEVALGASSATWIVLGRACAAALFDRLAIDFFERAIAAEPQSAAHRAQLGLYYFRQGVIDAAFHHLVDSRQIDPGNIQVARALFEISRALQELGTDPVALRHAPRTASAIMLPERLFVRARELAEAQVEPYIAVPGRVIAISATLAPGGAERQLVTMLSGLSQPRFDLDLTLFCTSLTSRFRRDFFLPLLEGTGIEVVLPEASLTKSYLACEEVGPFAELIRHFPPDMVTPIAFWLREFRRRKPQVVHAWQDLTSLMAVVAALLAGVPRIILCCRSVRPDNPRRRLRRFMRQAYRAVLDHPSVVLSNNSRAGADDYADWLEVDARRIEVVYNGIDFDRLSRQADPLEAQRTRRTFAIPDTAPVLGGVFRMSEEKRPLLWVEVAALVAAQCPDIHFVICGDGPLRDDMRSQAEKLGIADRLHLAGAQSNIGSWFKLMDVVMLTSRHEGLPNVLLEAQSLGVPVVAPDVGGTAEVVEQSRTGWTVKDADASRLAERVLFCLSDRAWRQAASERAPQFVRERFGIETMLRRTLDVYGIR